jgi:hypothetical protein
LIAATQKGVSTESYYNPHLITPLLLRLP